MPLLLNRLPFTEEASEVAVRGERVRIRANQIIAWVSLTLQHIEEPNPAAIPFPVIVDTGHTHTFSIHQRHLIDWAGVRPDSMEVIGAARDRSQRVLLRAANLWFHLNERGERTRLTVQKPHRMKAEAGIAVYPEGDFPRLPILGLQAIADNELVLKVDGRRREATLRTAIRWWPFG